jgi:dienelactone hydrolase
MTTTTQARPASRGAGRHRSPEALVFAGATAAGLVHALDDAFVHRGPGLGLGQHALAGAIALIGAIAAAVAFPSLRPGLRATLSFAFGVLALVNGMLHVTHIRAHGAADGDLTGVLAAIAGVALLALAAWIPFAHRGEGSAPPWRRWTVRALVLPVGIVAIFVTLLPIAFSIFDAHKAATPIGAPPDAAYRDVTFRASDGLRIKGWYRPSRNGAAVLLVHGGGGDREGTARHARMLVRHGYGVLLYDARGRGESEGSPNGYGWKWTKDVAGALRFLERRPDVDPGRIGALGLSTGADVVLEAAATRRDIHAVVTDGAAAGSFADWQRLQGTTAMTPFFWTQFAALRVFTGDAPGRPLADLVPQIAAPMLLISTERHEEYDFNVKYARLARGRAEHWNIADVQHTHGLRDHPRAYERRVVGFLDRALR